MHAGPVVIPSIQSISDCTANCSEDGTTYVSGCTDSSYNDPACPDKGPFGGKSGQLLEFKNTLLTSLKQTSNGLA